MSLMSSLLKISWLIPAFPLFGSVLVGLLLISFNRTINRLTKPISFFLIACVLASTIISFLLLLTHASGEPYDWTIAINGLNFHFFILLDLLVEKILLIAGVLIIAAMTFSYYKLDRRQGYVRYLSILSAFSGIFFFFILNQFMKTLII